MDTNKDIKTSKTSHQKADTDHTNGEEGGLSFPLKLHAMLEDAETKSFSNVVSWQPGDKSFKVHDVNEFGSNIMPMYFNQTKFKSFQRQLNIYGYRRIQHGPLKGGYVHKCFIRYRPELSTGVIRRSNNAAKAAASAVAAKVMEMVTVKGNRVHVSPDADPMQLESVFDEIDDEPIKNIAASVDFGSCNLQGVLDRIFQADDNDGEVAPLLVASSSASAPEAIGAGRKQEGGNHSRTSSGFVMNLNQGEGAEEETDMEALFDMLANSGEADFAAGGEHDGRAASSESSASEDEQETEEQLSERIFPLKLHKMLENANRDSIEHIVSWVNDGTGFKVHDSKLFTEQVMPMYFDQTKYESFRRQLNLYNFARISRGPQRGVYSHPCFVTKRRDLLSSVTRKINGELQSQKPSSVPSSSSSATPSLPYQHYGY